MQLFCNLIGLHSWLQWNKSVYRLDSRPSTLVRVWFYQTYYCLVSEPDPQKIGRRVCRR